MTERTKWYERSPGNTSAIRIIAMISAAMGAWLIAIGSIMFVVAAVVFFLGNAEAIQIVMQSIAMSGLGATSIGLGEAAKAWQAGKE